MEEAAIKPDPVNQYVSAGVVSGIATVSIGDTSHIEVKYKLIDIVIVYRDSSWVFCNIVTTA